MVLRHVSFRCYVPGVTRIIANTDGADGLTKSCSDTIVFDDAASRIEAKLTALPASLQQYVKVKVYTVHSPLYVVF